MRHTLVLLGYATLSTALFTPVGLAAPGPGQLSPGIRSDTDAVDMLEPLRPKAERTEEDQDRLTSATLYAYGRVLLQRGEDQLALRNLQRAWRYNPEATAIVADIVPLALKLNRRPEAARYALLAGDALPEDNRLLMGLAAAASDNGNWTEALRLYERALKADSKEQPGVATVLIWLETGRLYFLNEQYDESARAFAKAREAIEDTDKLVLPEQVRKRLLGDAERTYLVMGESFLKAKRWEDAESAYSKAFAEDDKRPLLEMQLARIAEQRGQLDEARQHLEAYFASKSTDAGTDPYELLADIMNRADNAPSQDNDSSNGADKDTAKSPRPEFLAKLRELLTSQPENPTLRRYLAEQLLAADHTDEAADIAKPLQGEDASAVDWRLQATLALHQGNVAELLTAMTEAVAASSDLQSIEAVTDELLQHDALTEKVVAELESADATAEAPAGPGLTRAYLALRTGKIELLDRWIDAALKAESPAPGDAAIELGLELLRREQFQRSAALFQRIIDERLKSDMVGPLHFYRSGALALAEDTDAALAAARAAVAADDESPDFRQRIGWVLYNGHRYEEAEPAYVDFVERYNDSENPALRSMLRQARLVLSNICVHLDRLPDAEEWLEQVLDEYPEDIGALNDLGYLWVDQNKHLRRGLAMVQKAVAAEPENPAYRDSLGWAYFRLGRFDEAVAELEMAADVDDPDGVILDHLGDAYAAAGQMEKARQCWERAIKAFDEAGEADKRDAARKKLESEKE
ncbi:MAG: tetratricopeptide repeat protein [Planctomycetales bacterium]|nr:tetratricopeptide repeat protein [Planctomycetales bacterium]